MSSTPTLLFVHGAWHSPACWSKVTSQLQHQGYRCLAPQLEFCGTEEPVESLAGSISQVQDLIASETAQGNDVVLVNHSFGGCVGSSSVKGFTQKDSSRLSPGSGKVVGIIQLCAFTPPSKTALYDIIDLDTSFHHSGPDGWELIDNGEPTDLFYHDLSPEDAQLWKGQLLKHSTASLKDRESVYAGWADVPVWYLLCTRDQAIPVQTQEMMVAAARDAGADFTTKSLDSSHSPYLSKPKDTTEFILEALEDFKAKSSRT
jgi:pimeloyl-ACP methyl ester carboxylesterase